MKNTFAVYLYDQIFETTGEMSLHEIGDFPLENMYDYTKRLQSLDYPRILLRRESFSEYTSVHHPGYVEELAARSRSEDIELSFRLSFECLDMWHLLPGFEYGLGGMYNAIDLMKSGDIDRAFVLTLPSHHAYYDHAHGYCLVNTLAASARYAQAKGFRRILIIDWDFHHGDGTQDIFKDDPAVHTMSSHSILDLYMAAMRATERGTTAYSRTIQADTNIPITKKGDDQIREEIRLPGDFFDNRSSVEAFRKTLKNLEFEPDLILIFDGMDAHEDDFARDAIGWTDEDFDTLMKTALDFAGRHGCPVIASPGGSYKGGVAEPILKSHLDLLVNYQPKTE